MRQERGPFGSLPKELVSRTPGLFFVPLPSPPLSAITAIITATKTSAPTTPATIIHGGITAVFLPAGTAVPPVTVVAVVPLMGALPCAESPLGDVLPTTGIWPEVPLLVGLVPESPLFPEDDLFGSKFKTILGPEPPFLLLLPLSLPGPSSGFATGRLLAGRLPLPEVFPEPASGFPVGSSPFFVSTRALS